MLCQSFVFTASLASSDFPVALPTTRLNANYFVTASLGGVTNLFALDLPNGAGDRTAAQFRVVTSAPVQIGDKIEFQVYDLFSGTLALHPFEGLVNSGWGPDSNGYMKILAGGGILYLPIPLKAGDRINGVVVAVKGTGSASLTMTVYMLPATGVKVSLGSLTWSPGSSWADTALALTATTLGASQSLYFDFSGAFGLLLGTASVNYDRP
jgi:hypothetical protein